MLVVHPSSQCDVCLDPYNWSTPAKAPHAIQCGHIFCYDCLRSTHPSNCPLCRKAFDSTRIKKLHVDRATGDGLPILSGPVVEENELLRRVGLLFAEEAEAEDIDSLVGEVQRWLHEHAGHPHQALRNSIWALHQFKDMQVKRAGYEETIARLRHNHERHAQVKQQDLDTSMMVEANLLAQLDQMRADYDAQLSQFREQNSRMQAELDRYRIVPNANSNPLPRPPEIIPLVTSLTRETIAASTRSSQRGVVSLGNGVPPSAPSVTAPTSQSRSSSGSSRGSAHSVHFSDGAAGKESTYELDADGRELRQEKSKRPPHIVPGAPHAERVIPPRLTDGDSDATPRPFMPPHPSQWPEHLRQYAPKEGSPAVWVGDQNAPHERLPNEISYEESRRLYASAAARQAVSSIEPPPVIPPPPPGMPPMMNQSARPAAETGSARLRVVAPTGPVLGRSPMAWRPGPAHQEGYVQVYVPHTGLTWIPEEQAAKLPVRARGTESSHAYAIAKDPHEVDDEWRRTHDGASPGPNPLQLSGVPEASGAGSSASVVRGQYDPLPGTSSAVSTLFGNPLGSSDRTITATASSSNASLGAMGLLTAPSGTSRTTRTAPTRTTSEPLGLNLSSLPEPRARVPEPEPSPASSWGTIPPAFSRNSSLGNLHLNNFPSPHPFPRPSESADQLPIGELNGGPIVLTDALTPRQTSTSSLFGDDRSVSGRSDRSRGHAEPSGLLLSSSAGSSHQVVSSLQDLEDVNRSLMQLAASEEQPRRSTRPPSRHHSRQHSTTMSGDERDAMVGMRTGIALYSSRPATNYSSSRASSDPSTEDPSPPAQSRPRSGASTRSHAESTYSHQTSHSVHSSHSATSHRSSDPHRRARRGSTASALDSFDREPAATWTTPADMQPYGSSRDPYASDTRSQKSHESVPRAMEGLGSGPASMSSLLLNFDPPSTSSAVTGNGEEAAGIHAPRPVNGRRSSMFGGAWTARSGR